MTEPLTEKELEQANGVDGWATTFPDDRNRLLATINDLQAEVARLWKVVNTVIKDPHQSYEGREPGQYGIGVADGHRCARLKVEAALARTQEKYDEARD